MEILKFREVLSYMQGHLDSNPVQSRSKWLCFSQYMCCLEGEKVNKYPYGLKHAQEQARRK